MTDSNVRPFAHQLLVQHSCVLFLAVSEEVVLKLALQLADIHGEPFLLPLHTCLLDVGGGGRHEIHRS